MLSNGHTHTTNRPNYSNPHCECAPRVKSTDPDLQALTSDLKQQLVDADNDIIEHVVQCM